METAAQIPKYNLNEEQEKRLILREYRSLLRDLKTKLKPGDKDLIRLAFEMSAEAHKTMRRKSGEPYILHPLAVAKICVEEIGLGVRSTICSLMHDTVEDTDVTLEDIEREFGNEIARIVDGLTKISNVIDVNASRQAENFKKFGRPKSIHSISNKMKKKGVDFEEVYDLFAIRVILDSSQEKEKEDCWKVYSMITDEYTPSPERLRDWLSNPKSNGYEALHTTVMGPQGKWVEVQIRSKRMNEIAEKGLAAHWKYKEGAADESRFDKWFQQIREVLNTHDNDSVDFLQDFKTSFLAEEIYVYTPKGDVKMLPVGSTALDFAFAIHSAIGVQCIGAKVNHKLVPLSHKLRSGDQVEIITSSKQKESGDWLAFVITSKAKGRIRDSLKEEKRKVADEGKYTVQRKLEGLGVSMSQHNIDELVHW